MALRGDKVFEPLKFPVIVREEQTVKRSRKGFHYCSQAKVLVMIAFHKIGFV